MSTPKQIAASRANGAKSKGPSTPEGKLVSSRNSTRHGLFAENIVLETEKTGAFLELVESLFEEHNPRTPTQKLLVENLAAARWRQWRIWGMQKVAFDDEVAAPSITDDPPLRAVLAWKNSADSMRTHELLLRYEIALDRQISRSLLRLLQLQATQERSIEPAKKESAEPAATPPARKPPASEPQSKPQEDSPKGAARSVLGDCTESPKGAARTSHPTGEPIAARSVLGDCTESPKGAARASKESISAKRTRQPVETTIRHTPSSPSQPRLESRSVRNSTKEG